MEEEEEEEEEKGGGGGGGGEGGGREKWGWAEMIGSCIEETREREKG